MQTFVTVPVTLVTSLQRKFHLRVAEWMTAFMLATFGAELAAQPTLFAANPFFGELARFAPQSIWASVLLLIGFARLSALVINGAWRLSPHVRVALALFSFMVWIEITSGISHVGRPTLGMAVYPWLAVADFYAVFRAAGDARLADEQAKVIATAL